MVSKIPNKNYIKEDIVIKVIMASAELPFRSAYFGLSALYLKSRNKKVARFGLMLEGRL